MFQNGTKNTDQVLCKIKGNSYRNVWNVENRGTLKNVYREQVCLKGIKGSKKLKMWECKRIAGENNVDCIFFYAEGIIPHEFMPAKQTVNSECRKEAIKRLIAWAHCVRPEFRKVGPGIFCTTMYRYILRALSPRFWRNEGSPCYPIQPTPPI
jgi:hypothetical protein